MNNKNDNFRTDSRTLNRVFAGVGNPATGVGTSRDKSTYAEINSTPYLDQLEMEQLAQVGIIHRLCWLYPTAARAAGFEFKKTTKKNNLHLIHQYYRNLQMKEGGVSLMEAMTEASGLGRECGDGYILIGVADGKSLSEPLDLNNIFSVEWLKVLSRWELQPVYRANAKQPDGYRLRMLNDSLPDGTVEYDKFIHKSRVRRFPGIRLSNVALKHRQGANLSVIESIINSYLRHETALGTSNLMLANHQLRTLGLKGLGQLIQDDIRANSTAGQQQLMDRLMTLDMGASAARTLLYDLEEEKVENLNITYGGVWEIVDRLSDDLASHVDVPRSALFNELGKTGLTSGEAFRLQAFDLAKRTQSWQYEHWLGHLEFFTRLAIAAKDCKVKMPSEGFEIVFPLNYLEEPAVAAENAKKMAEKNKTLKEAEIFTAEELRGSYQGSSFDTSLNPE